MIFESHMICCQVRKTAIALTTRWLLSASVVELDESDGDDAPDGKIYGAGDRGDHLGDYCGERRMSYA
jgi:hypothetical protein